MSLTPQYPADIVSALETCGHPFATLPVLEYKDVWSVSKDTPVMKFTDSKGRAGLAVKVRSRDSTLEMDLFFRTCFTTDPDMWIFDRDYSNNHALGNMYDKLHEPEHLNPSMCNYCPLCPKFKRCPEKEFLIELLLNKDPLLHIWGTPLATSVPVINWKEKFEIARSYCHSRGNKIEDLEAKIEEDRELDMLLLAASRRIHSRY